MLRFTAHVSYPLRPVAAAVLSLCPLSSEGRQAECWSSAAYVEQSSQPELSLLLDLVARYREASVDVGMVGRAGPLVRPVPSSAASPERRLSIKP